MKQMKSTIEVLSNDEIQMIHEAAINILAKTGFHLPNDICLERCRKAGAQVDFVSSIVRLDKVLINSLIEEMQKRTSILPNVAPKLNGSISTQVFVMDYLSKKRRYGLSEDIMKGIALVKHTRNIPSCNAVTIPSDVDPRVTDLHSYKLIMEYSDKPGGTYILSKETAQVIMDMSELMGRKAYYLFESVSPLRFRKETLEIGLLFADRGHYLGIGPMIMGGLSAPITLAGTLTLIVAEVLFSLFAVYAISGQLGCFFGHGSHTADPRSLICSFGSPNQALIAVATAQIARFYGLPGGSNSALSDALMPDFQCGFEKTLSALTGSLAGSVSIGCQGIVGADQGFSFEQLLIDDEWLDAYNYVVSGFEVNAETIAEELIQEIGIGGQFISEEHTVQHLHDSWWQSRIFLRDAYDAWIKKGAPDLLKIAHDQVEELTFGYTALEPVVSSNQYEALERIVYEACNKILNN